jgi:hypothetical protein
MPKGDKYGQNVQYPVLADVPNIETALSTLVNAVVPLTVLRFANANARAATLSGDAKPVPGMVTYLIAEDRWEGRQADGTWLLLSDGPWQPLTYKTGYAANGGSPGWRRKAGGGIELRGRIQRSSGASLEDDGTFVPFASVPSSVAPATSRYYIVPSKRVTTDGVSRYTARIEVQSDGVMTYTVESGGGISSSGSPGWFGLDGVMFSPAGD